MAAKAGAPDDSELVRRCLDGRRDAFDALMARHYRGVYNLVYRMLGNAQDASDLTQEIFLRIYTRLHTFQQGRSFLTWVRRVAANLCIDHLRRGRIPDASLDQRLESGAQHADTSAGGSPADALQMAENSRRVLAAVQRLPARQRAVLVLRHIEGMKLQEIADTLRAPLGTVKTLLFRGRQAVREMVGDL